ncbi:uncharacterized protein [Prorops nasuta]|uniref:uncharacterized protein n=1 Tax=Prorops nasuta TaxID=863751 RepID=UPI0034CFA5B4
MIMKRATERWNRGRWSLLIGVLGCLWGPGSSMSFENKTDLNDGRVQIFSPRMEYNEWTPLDRGDPLKNNPTFDYVPPVLDRVQYWLDSHTTEPSSKRDILVLGVTAKKASPKIPEQYLQQSKFMTRGNTRHQDQVQENFFKDFTGSNGAEPPKLLRITNFRSDIDYRHQNGLQMPSNYYQRPTNFYKSKPHHVPPFQTVEQSSSFKVMPKDKTKFELDPSRDHQFYSSKNLQRLQFPPRQIPSPSKFGFKAGYPAKEVKNYPQSSVSFEKSNLVYQSSQVYSGNWPENSPYAFEAISHSNRFNPNQFVGTNSNPNFASSNLNFANVNPNFGTSNQFASVPNQFDDSSPSHFSINNQNQLGPANLDPFEVDHHVAASTHTEVVVRHDDKEKENSTNLEKPSEEERTSNVTVLSSTMKNETIEAENWKNDTKMHIVIANTSKPENETAPIIVMPEHYKDDGVKGNKNRTKEVEPEKKVNGDKVELSETGVGQGTRGETVLSVVRQNDDTRKGMDFRGVSSKSPATSSTSKLLLSSMPLFPTVSSMPFNPSQKSSMLPMMQPNSMTPMMTSMPPMPFQHLSPPMPSPMMIPPKPNDNLLKILLQATTTPKPPIFPVQPSREFLIIPSTPSTNFPPFPIKHSANNEIRNDSPTIKTFIDETKPTSEYTTEPSDTTTLASLTTDPIFSHYKQPAKPIHGPVYLIIQGHSKVKTYKPIDKYSGGSPNDNTLS